MDFETRVAESPELRTEPATAEGRAPKITGYAAVFNSASRDLGGFTEIIKPGAFSRSLKSGADVRALAYHDPNRLLGRTTSGTLRVAEDDRGLRIEVDPPDTSYARDLAALVERRDVAGMSFAFKRIKSGSPQERWYRQDGKIVRELLDIDLLEVTVTGSPAYPATEVAMRSIDPEVLARANEMARETSRPEFWKRQRMLMRGLSR